MRDAPRRATRASSRSAAAPSSTPDTRELLAGLPVVFLRRRRGRQARRPGRAPPAAAVNPRKQWRELMDERRPLYTEVAARRLATDDRTPEEVADAILTHWSEGSG